MHAEKVRRNNMSCAEDFKIKNGILLSYRGNDSEVVIPDGVVCISQSTFAYRKGLKKVTIPDTVKIIDSYAFYNCSDLLSVRISENVTEIGKCAFSGCSNLMNLKIPNSVEKIGYYAFAGVGNIDYDGEIPYGAKCLNGFIDDNFVYSDNTKTTLCACSALTTGKIDIPSSVTNIGDDAFSGCKNITDISIPNNVVNIGYSAFSGCESLINITIPCGVTILKLRSFFNCTSLENIILPESLMVISSKAFAGCSTLKNITIPPNVYIIDECAFYNCENLEKITISNPSCHIKNNSFENCERLSLYYKNISISDIPSKLKKSALLGFVEFADSDNSEDVKAAYLKYAKTNKKKLFAEIKNCPKLLYYMCENKIVTISDCDMIMDVIKEDLELKAMFIEYQNVNFNSNQREKYQEQALKKAISNPFPVAEMKKLWKYKKAKDGTLIITKYIGHEADVCVPEMIGKTAVTVIDDYAFKSCDSMINVIIPNSIISIGELAFESCTNLTSVTIPDSVTSIGNSAFSGCTGLTAINVDSQNRKYSSLDGVLFNKGKSRLIQYPIGNTRTSYTIPKSVTAIGSLAFRQCTSLTSVTIPNRVTSIDNWTFYHCTSLTSINIPNGVTNIGMYAFKGCTNLTSVTIPNSVTYIVGNAFSCCENLTIYTSSGSYAEQYAKENNIPFLIE